MTISYAHIKSDSGSFIFIRLLDSIEQSKHNIAAWAEQLSSQHFSGLPVVVHNHDQDGNEINTIFPDQFHLAVAGFDGAGVGLSSMQVDVMLQRTA